MIAQTVWICREVIYQQQETQEDTNSIKTPTEKKKKPMASQICQEDTLQQEETNGIKNPPRRHPQQEENQGFKTPAEKNLQQEIQRRNNKN